jgi:peptide/nickel transport system permease protein
MSRRRQLLAYLASRLLLLPVMLWLIASLVFLLLRVAPGDPIDALLGTRAPEAARAALRHQLGLDQSLASQYGHYLWDLLHGQLGTSLTNQESVLSVIGRSLPASLELGVVALLIAAVLGLAVGFSGIARPEGRLDLAGRLYGIGTYALPPFWAAVVVQLVFAVWLGWLPVGGRFPPPWCPQRQRLLPVRQPAGRQLEPVQRQPAPPGVASRHLGRAAQRHLRQCPAAQPAAGPALRLCRGGPQSGAQ